jgi:hypothetical protein
MKTQNKLFLDTNRHFLKAFEQGAVRGLQSQAAERVLREEFCPDYPLFSHDVFEHLHTMMRDLYKYFDRWLRDNPNWQPEVTRYGMSEDSISFLEANRALADQLQISGSARGVNIEGLLRIMLTEFNAGYQFTYDDPYQPGKMVSDVYRLFLERKIASAPQPQVAKKKKA